MSRPFGTAEQLAAAVDQPLYSGAVRYHYPARVREDILNVCSQMTGLAPRTALSPAPRTFLNLGTQRENSSSHAYFGDIVLKYDWFSHVSVQFHAAARCDKLRVFPQEKRVSPFIRCAAVFRTFLPIPTLYALWMPFFFFLYRNRWFILATTAVFLLNLDFRYLDCLEMPK